MKFSECRVAETLLICQNVTFHPQTPIFLLSESIRKSYKWTSKNLMDFMLIFSQVLTCKLDLQITTSVLTDKQHSLRVLLGIDL